MCGREEKFLVDLKHLQVYLLDVPVYQSPHRATIWLFLQTFILSLGSSLHTLFPLPFPSVCPTSLLGTKQNSSYYHSQGILSSMFVVFDYWFPSTL